MEILLSPKATNAKTLSTETLIQCNNLFAKPCYRGRLTLFWSSPMREFPQDMRFISSFFFFSVLSAASDKQIYLGEFDDSIWYKKSWIKKMPEPKFMIIFRRPINIIIKEKTLFLLNYFCWLIVKNSGITGMQ